MYRKKNAAEKAQDAANMAQAAAKEHQAEETHVADIPGIAGKWDHTTHIGTYTD